ncbi:deoxyribose-phosphate aldolase [Anthocerotibacter panamensis]|uniref:deoxyribose-phosphate aldolase n=1 Tax=Anthocerotibacter panamensis TaxID=2857077 RepID=UPI001C402345|nr:deoxyribose-phosphate aldolase [Anthocerotibacter panamensis]
MAEIHPELQLAQFIEHTCLGPITTVTTVEQFCWEADRYRFAAVCVPPLHLASAVNTLHKKPVEVWSVVGFPLGTSTDQAKLYAAQQLTDLGAQGLEVVPQLTWFKEGDPNRVYRELAQIVQATRIPIRAVLEISLLQPTELKTALQICGDAGVRGVKTGSGWGGDVTREQVQQVAGLTRGRIEIKAAGGIKTLDHALELLLAGATRLGTSRSVELLHQQARQAAS